ncbi:hypothetical protein LAV72_12515 [Lysinibacillus xylanilyticus]|uniref:hypothetical protein n=1 Tax=Lysinibacillus xylanilyticus TaxID=582475 RepID=UPI002B24818B|nr:hypothetical protein [Lysinibacillus xylanilyticus]MEB2300439.1 hypothetical protein [Lysinibacillus xylanilyticus]
MNMISIHNDGDKVPLEIEKEYSIRYLNLPVTKEDKLSLDFVGIIIKEENPLIVFPKHFVTTYNDLQKDGQLLIQVLRKIQSKKGFGETLNDKNFPLNAYLYICDFYKKHGLYMEQERIIKPGYKGKIHWKHTIAKSHKILNNSNIIFMPFMLEQKIDQSVLITTCMEEVLANGYKIFGKYFNIGVKYSVNRNLFGDYQIKQLARQLKLLRNKHFKDSTLKLIDALIRYFEWASSTGNEVHFLTTNFEIVWEDMIKHYLDNRLSDIDTSQIPHKMITNLSSSTRYHFNHKVVESIKQDTPSNRSFSVEYDHIAYDAPNNELVLMDAKYYQQITGLNYKQFSYAHLLLNKINEYTGETTEKTHLINGLILPTEQEYYSKVHINRESIDGVLITEHYLNVRAVMSEYVS